MIDRSIYANNLHFRTARTPLLSCDFRTLAKYSPYAHALAILQSIAEEVFERRLNELGSTVIRPLRVTHLTTGKEGLLAHFSDGQTVKAKYIVAADGGHSIIRRLLDIPFRDPTTQEDIAIAKKNNAKDGTPWMVADVKYSGTIPSCISPTDLTVFLGPKGFLTIVPIPYPGEDKTRTTTYRMTCPVEADTLSVTPVRSAPILSAAPPSYVSISRKAFRRPLM